MGDLGISVKLDFHDEEGIEPKYYGKGLTHGFVTPEFKAAIDNGKPLSKKSLIECDKFAFIRTFEVIEN